MNPHRVFVEKWKLDVSPALVSLFFQRVRVRVKVHPGSRASF